MHDIAWWWSWLLMIVGVTGLWLAGRKLWWAWLIGIFSEVLWIVYALVTKQYGFIAFAAAYMIVFSRNAIGWYKDTKSKENHAGISSRT